MARELQPKLPERGPVAKRKRAFPWLAFTLALATTFLFWIYPMLRGEQPVRVEFRSAQE